MTTQAAKAPRSSRYAAAEVLCRRRQRREPVTLILDEVAEVCALAPNDRQLAMNMIYGVLRQQEYLETLLQQFCRQPLSRLKPFVRQTLLIGLYQIIFLDRIPDSAAVNEAVKALQAARLPKQLQGLVNGILRNAVRQRAELPTPDDGDTLSHPFLNHPPWLTHRWSNRYGQERMEEICQANNQQQPLVLQVNIGRCSRAQLRHQLELTGLTIRDGRYSPDSLILDGFSGRIESLPGFEQGFFQVQGEAAQLAVHLMAPLLPGGSYLDGCAGLGGKTSQLLTACRNAGHQNPADEARLQAVEPEAGRRKKFQANLERLHPDYPLSPFPGTLQEFSSQAPRPFDGILIDAPCSGTGVIGRQPDIRWNRLESELKRYQETQLEILTLAAGLLAPQGILVYATCSLEPEENQEVIDLFLARQPNFQLSDCASHLPSTASPLIQGPFFAPTPDQGTDGFFAARLVRNQNRS